MSSSKKNFSFISLGLVAGGKHVILTPACFQHCGIDPVAQSVSVYAEDPLEDQADFLFIPRHQELLGDCAKGCDISISIEKTGHEGRGQYTLSYVLFRCVCKPVNTCVSGIFFLGRYFPWEVAGRVLELTPGTYGQWQGEIATGNSQCSEGVLAHSPATAHLQVLCTSFPSFGTLNQ